jgi:hypothetical protein
MPTPEPRLHRSRLLSARIALCLISLGPAGIQAQETIRHLTGTVTDASHEPLAGAVVQLHDDTTGSVISYITNRTGRYIFPRFSGQDDFHVSAKFRGRESRSKSLSKFDAKPNRNIALVIKLQ